MEAGQVWMKEATAIKAMVVIGEVYIMTVESDIIEIDRRFEFEAGMRR